jgi:allophanate hydrolase subunit 1
MAIADSSQRDNFGGYEAGFSQVVRAFVRMRNAIGQSKEIAKKLTELERRIECQDESIVEIVQTVRSLMAKPQPEPERPRRKIGFL